MKKVLVLLVLATVIGTAAFAIPAFGLSAGAGGLFQAGFGGGIKVEDGGVEVKVTLPTLGGGGYGFLDLTFAEIDVAFQIGSLKPEYEGPGGIGFDDIDLSYTALNFGILGKYPFEFGQLTAFPLAGVDYQYVLSAKDEDGDKYEGFDGNGNGKASDFSSLWIRLGGGVDYNITDALYIRGEALYGIRLASKVEGDIEDMVKLLVGNAIDVSKNLGHGLLVKIGVGYKFF
jgi:hypothetical protein